MKFMVIVYQISITYLIDFIIQLNCENNLIIDDIDLEIV